MPVHVHIEQNDTSVLCFEILPRARDYSKQERYQAINYSKTRPLSILMHWDGGWQCPSMPWLFWLGTYAARKVQVKTRH